MTGKLIAPSVLAADYTAFGDGIRALNRSEADWIHFDVMDGHFVPEISFGQEMLRAVKKIAEKPLDVHLMIEDPLPKIESFVLAGADRITFHIEAAEDVQAVIDRIHSFGLPAAVSVKPATPISQVYPYLESLDMVLVMTVEPGFGGQPILPETIQKIRDL
ncbi:MAG: ribulose-phosphate 3-epimerase, partial [Lachnospiraceae bacterium]|nr:ribulose-phosphate 3-epimerase [Lachnospiraceae bacterium]